MITVLVSVLALLSVHESLAVSPYACLLSLLVSTPIVARIRIRIFTHFFPQEKPKSTSSKITALLQIGRTSLFYRKYAPCGAIVVTN